MALVKTLSNKFLYELGLGTINCSSDTFKLVLLADGFTYNPDTILDYSDLASGDELSTAYGYTVGGITLVSSVAWNQDDTNNMGSLEWTDPEITADGGTISFSAILVYDDTHGDDVIVGCVELGEVISVVDTDTFTFEDMGIDLFMSTGA